MFSHYIITRFNVVKAGLAQYALSQRGNVIQTEEWLRRRFELFDQYCFPSVRNQVCQDFKWLVLFSIGTPDKYLNKIETYRVQCPQFVPLFVPEYDDEIAMAINYIKQDSHCEQIVTTRLDNDDCIRYDYVDLIQKSCKPDFDNVFLIYRFGYQYKEGSKIINWFGDDFNHFESRVEDITTLQTVYVKDDRHDLISHYGSIVHMEDNDAKTKIGMWVEVVHEGNVVNNAAPYSSRPIWINSEDFGGAIELSRLKYVLVRVLYSIKKRLRLIE